MTKETLFQMLGPAAADLAAEFGEEFPPKQAGIRWGVLAACAALAAASVFWAVRTPAPPLVLDLPSAAAPAETAEASFNDALPEIRYGIVEAAADYALVPPEGGTYRKLTQTDILILLGGSEQLNSLGWDGYTLEGGIHFNADGSVWMLSLYGNRSPLDHFELSLASDKLPPVCVMYEESTANELWGVEVWAEKHDSRFGLSRRVSFLHDGVGCRFAVTGEAGTAQTAEEMAGRLVRLAILDGFHLSAVSSEGAEPFVPGESGAPADAS